MDAHSDDASLGACPGEAPGGGRQVGAHKGQGLKSPDVNGLFLRFLHMCDRRERKNRKNQELVRKFRTSSAVAVIPREVSWVFLLG